MCVGPRKLWTALLLPQYREPGRKLPVVLDPYGGPHHQTVMKARNSFLTSQWLADQGFAVLVTDGRARPAVARRGSAPSTSTSRDPCSRIRSTPCARAGRLAIPDLDLDPGRRSRGWSFGGYLAALAVLRPTGRVPRRRRGRAGHGLAPVRHARTPSATWADPGRTPSAYDARVTCCRGAPKLARPLLLIHGLADDNVLVANTLQLSRRAAGGRHAALGAAAHPASRT